MHRALPRLTLPPLLLPLAIGGVVLSLPATVAGVDSGPTPPEVAASPVGDEPEETPTGAQTSATMGPGSLEGVDWVLMAYRSGGTVVELDDTQGPARLRFEEGRVGGSAGCNRLVGGYTLEGEALRFAPSMAATMMACPEPLMTQEQAVYAALAEVASHRRNANRLELLDAQGALVLRFVALESLSLTGPVWRLLAYNNGKQAIVSALGRPRVTLELREDGTLGGFDGCNRFMSGFTLEGGRLTIGPIATTRMACRGPEGAAEQAAAFAAALGSVTGFRIEGRELTLLNAEGTPAARFQAESEGAASGASDAQR